MLKFHRELNLALKPYGLTVEQMPRGHAAILDAAGKRVGTAATSPSDRRSLKNLLADLKRRGLIW